MLLQHCHHMLSRVPGQCTRLLHAASTRWQAVTITAAVDGAQQATGSEETKRTESLCREAFQPCHESWLMGGLGWTKGIPFPSQEGVHTRIETRASSSAAALDEVSWLARLASLQMCCTYFCKPPKQTLRICRQTSTMQGACLLVPARCAA